MRFLTLFMLSGTTATAHVGHLGEVAGHDHWVAGAAIGIAIGLSVWGALKGRGSDEPSSEGEEETPSTQEEAA